MAEGAKDGGGEDAFSFVDKVRYMMYSEQEKESFLIEKKEKEEKKKGMRTRALSLHQQGWSWTKIATELGCHRTTVMRLVHKWQQTGCIADLPHRRKPRPPSSPQQQMQQPQDRLPCGPPLRWVQEENRRPAARSTTVTVRRRLKELRSQLGILAPPSPKPQHLLPPVCKPQRTPPQEPCKPLRTLQEVTAFSAEELSRIVYSDVRVFVSDREGGARVWRAGRPPPLDSGAALRRFFAGGGLCATFWLCVSGSGAKGELLHVPDELTEERYVQILHNGLLPSAAAIYGLDAHRFLFAQDPSSVQASPAVAAFLRQQQVQCCEWPARGPDANPCDLLWDELEACMPCPGMAPASQQELVQRVRRGYEAVEPEYVRWLVAPPRIRSLCRRMLIRRTLGTMDETEDE